MSSYPSREPRTGSSASVLVYAVTDPATALAFLRGQLGYLAAHGFNVHLACGRTTELDDFAARECVTVHDVPLSRAWWARGDLGSLVRAIRVLRSVRPDVLNYSTPKAAMVWAIASWFNRPNHVVYLLRGLRLEGQRPWSVGFALLWLAELLATKSAHVTVCVSHSLRDKALSLRLVRKHRSLVLDRGSSNGVDIDRFQPPTAEGCRAARVHYGLGENRFVLGYIGRVNRDKGVPELLDAVESASALVPDLECLLVGSVEPGFDLDDELQRRPTARTRTHWFPATETVEQAYAALDVFILPSHREGMSNALLEAQAMEIPCITTTATGCVDAVLPDSSALIVPVRDNASLSDAIIRVAHDLQRRRAMGRAGRNHVVSHFSPEEKWQDYAALYTSQPTTAGDLNETDTE
jgi:glycosyltransferase involved in cell wall biosynthesis